MAIADTAPLTPFPDNTRWTAIGDSITHNGWYQPYVDLYYITRFPKQKLDSFNCGINGDTVEGGFNRYSWDIAPNRPTVATIMFGMNDVSRDLYAVGKTGPEIEKLRLERIDAYEANLRKLVQNLQRDKANVIIILPSIFDNTVEIKPAHYPGLNEALGECGVRAQKVAADMGCSVIDFYHPMLKTTLERQKADPQFSMISGDRVHPTVLGHLFMAYLFLKSQNVPADVARLSINGTDATVSALTNCQVDQAKVEDGKLSFRYTANAIPFPIEHWTSPATTWAPFVDDLDREIFQITALPAGTYQLKMDGHPIRTYTADELAHGVNLATESKTPEARQAQKVWNAYKTRLESVFKLRTIASVERAAFTPDIPHTTTLQQIEPLLEAYLKREVGSPWEKAIEGEIKAYRIAKPQESQLHASMDASLQEIRAIAQPLPHDIELSRVPAN